MDKDVIKKTAKLNDSSSDVGDVLLRWCDTKEVLQNVTHHNRLRDVSVDCEQILTSPSAATSSLYKLCAQAREHKFLDLSNVSVQMTFDSNDEATVDEKLHRCE